MNAPKSLAIVLLSLVVLQTLCFGPILGHVGFYLDDWLALSLLHFAPKHGGYFGLLYYYLLVDTRVLIRPLEAIHFASAYYFCADKPLGWHLLNFLFEIAAACFSYSVFLRLTARRAIAFLGGVLILLYPSHDATHYWVVCSSVGLSLALYLASFRASLQATDLYLAGSKSKSALWQLLSLALFLTSLLNYETFLPLAALSVIACAALAYRQSREVKQALVVGAYAALPMILGVVALLLFLKVLVPVLGHGYSHAFKLDMALILSTVGRGLLLNAPPEALQFFCSQARNAAATLSASEMLRLLALAAVSSVTVVCLARFDKSDEPNKAAPLRSVDLLLLGLMTIAVSYTIFGLSAEYSPTFMTMVNRINTGASVGVALIAMACCQALVTWAWRRQIAYPAPLALIAAAAVILFVLADWGLSKPWIASWTLQKEVRKAVSQLSGKIDPDASLLLVNCPGYVMWSPVFDGVWDFQSMVRITLDLPNFKADVVSDRLSLSSAGLKDVSYGYECGSYSFDKLYLMVAPRPELFPVHNPAQFIDLVERRGMTFGLNEKTLNKWREQVLPSPSPVR